MLYDLQYVNELKEVIRTIALDNHNCNSALRWEMMKCGIRSYSIKFSSTQKKTFNKTEQLLTCEINSLESHIHANHNDLQGNNKLHEKRKDLEKLIEYKSKGILIRSKARWYMNYEEGEKNTKYFLNLEKRNYSNKTISKL